MMTGTGQSRFRLDDGVRQGCVKSLTLLIRLGEYITRLVTYRPDKRSTCITLEKPVG